jgi:hypothetical protein
MSRAMRGLHGATDGGRSTFDDVADASNGRGSRGVDETREGPRGRP